MAIPTPQQRPAVPAPRPTALELVPADRIITADVRDQLRAGAEPFGLIMAARRKVPSGGALHVRAIFEPVPLYAVMRKQHFANWTEKHADDDWSVWFYPEPGAADDDPAPPAAAAVAAPDDGTVVIDVRGLEPPEPMVRTLAALEALAPGATLVQLNERVPQFLLPVLEERGFTFEVRTQEPALVRVFIRRRGAGT
jgi:uncharacterized protein (DUF2249 family)